ncbi:MAG: methionine biosynthesis protein MetW [Spirochaetota bacterium]
MDRNAQRFSYDEIAGLVENNSTVLDLGCGDGELLHRLISTRNVSGRGVEIEEAMIRECLAKGISVFQGDLDEGLKEYATGSYDYVILNETLQALHEPVLLLKEMVRVGRRAIVNFPNFGYILNRAQLFFRGRMPVTKDIPYEWYDTPNIHFCTRRDFLVLCRDLAIPVLATIDLGHDRRVPRFLANLFATECCFMLKGSE